MPPHQIFAIILALCALNGVMSPYLLIVLAFAPVWLPNWMGSSASGLFYLASLLTATTTLLVSAVPAGLVENAFPRLRGTPTILWIWAAVALVLSLPGVVRFLGFLIGG
jgi:hypothetical protein